MSKIKTIKAIEDNRPYQLCASASLRLCVK